MFFSMVIPSIISCEESLYVILSKQQSTPLDTNNLTLDLSQVSFTRDDTLTTITPAYRRYPLDNS